MQENGNTGKSRRIIVGLCIVAAILIGKLFYIQIVEDKYKINADNNAMVYSVIYPTRGLIYDRNGKILVGNAISYDLMVTPSEVREFDTTLLASLTGTDTAFIRGKMDEFRRRRRSIGFQSVTLIKQMKPEQYALFAEQSYRFPGFYGHPRTIRKYPYNAGGNLLGYVSEVDAEFIKKSNGEYRAGDYAGKTGIEATCEELLKGEKGYNIYLRNAHNKIESSYNDGEYDKAAIPGKDIYTTIDAELQNYGQSLMANKTGSIVAIEPSTGEILTLVSSPGIDVEVLADIGKYYNDIASDPGKPMFNRAVQSPYPPGSIFKMVNGLIGIQEGVLTPQTRYACDMGYHFGKHKVGCHRHRSPIDLNESIMMSCNAYYCNVFRNILENSRYGSVSAAFDKWEKYVRSFGFGSGLGSDFPSESGGFVPSSGYYDKIYGKNRWRSTTVLSLSIGQGELGITPLQMANLCAIFANRGHYYTPHIIKDSPENVIDAEYKKRRYTLIDTVHFQKIIDGMFMAVNSKPGDGGTATVAAVKGLDICGKTGTAQNPHGEDHSVFICFAPRENPVIAVAVYVENGGSGARWAAPIASLIVEKYINDTISAPRLSLETRMLEGNLTKRQ